MKTLLRCALLAFASIACAENGGPSLGGYVYSHVSSPQTFQSIVGTQDAIVVFGGNSTQEVDDAETNIALGFTFPFFGTTYTEVHFSTNGLLCLGSIGSREWSNVNFTTTAVDTNPATGANLPAIAPFWDDLIFRANLPGGLWVKKRAVDGLRELVVEWDRVCMINVANTEVCSFQAILREDGSITCHYPDVDVADGGSGRTRGSSATIGIRNVDGETGPRLQASFNATNYLTSGDRIDFFRLPDARDLALDFTGRTTSARIVTTLATADLVEDPNVSGGSEGKSVWFRWVAPGPGHVSFSTAASNFDTVMAVLDATQGTAITTSLVFNDDGGGDGTSRADSIEAVEGQVFLIMVAGKDKGSGITSGTAQVSASFAPLERVSFYTDTISGIEGRESRITVTRAHVNPSSLSVDVLITDPEGNETMTTLSATGDDNLPDLTFTPPDDAVFTVRRVYEFHIVAKPGSYVVQPVPSAFVTVTDNDPMLLPASSFTGVVGIGELGGVGSPISNGLVTLKITATGGFSGKLTQAGVTFAFKGQFDNAGNAETLLVRKGLAPIKLKLFLQEGGTRVHLFVDRTEGRGGVLLNALTFSAKNKVPPAVQGRYTLGSSSRTIEGSYYGTGTVSAPGGVKFAGVLADGTPFSFGTKLGPASAYRVSGYAKTHGGKGYFQVEVNLDQMHDACAAYRPAGIVDKKTTAFQGGYYDQGHSVAISAFPVLGATDQASAGFVTTGGKGTFGLGALDALTDTVDFTFDVTGKATSTTAGFTLTLDRKTGLYKGTRPNPAPGGKPIPFGGALLRGEDSGTGAGTGFGNSHDATTAHAAFIVPKL